MYSITEPAMPCFAVNSRSASCCFACRSSTRGSCGAARACGRPRASSRPSGSLRRTLDLGAVGRRSRRAPRAAIRPNAASSVAASPYVQPARAVSVAIGLRLRRRRERVLARRMYSARRLRTTRTSFASMPMSASRISPVRGSTTRRPDRAVRRLRARSPAHRRVADVGRVELGVVGLDLDVDRILEADALERLVPFEDALPDRLAVLHRDVAVEPVDDRLLRLGHRRGRILLLEAPAVDVALDRHARHVGREVERLGREVADALVGEARRASARRAASRTRSGSRGTGCARRAA